MSELARAAAIAAVSQLAGAAGFDAVQQSSAEILGELLLRYIGEVGVAAHGYAESTGRTDVTPVDVVRCRGDGRGSRYLGGEISVRAALHMTATRPPSARAAAGQPSSAERSVTPSIS